MTARSRWRFRAPWFALPLAFITVFGGAAPAFAEDAPAPAESPAPVVVEAPVAVEPAPAPTPAAAEEPAPAPTPAATEAAPAPAPTATLAPVPASTERVARAAAVATPVITITPSTFDPAIAQTLTVSGTGFVGDGAVNGTYVVLGKTADWAAGTTPLGVSFPIQAWVQPAQIVDGAFSTTLNVSAGALTLGTSYSVGTFAAHALAYSNRTLDTWTALTLRATPVANPVLTVSTTTIDPTVENVLTVSGTGYVGAGAVNGNYIVVGPTASWSAGTSPLGVTFGVTAWVRPASIVDGAFSTTVTIPANKLTAGTAYSIGSFASQALAYSNRTLDTWQPLTVQVPPTANPQVTLGASSINGTIANTLTVSGTGFLGAGAVNGAYVVIGKTADWAAGTSPASATFPIQVWVQPAQITDGAFSTSLSIPAGTLTTGTGYSVGTFAAHALAFTNRSLDSWTAFSVTGSSTGPGTDPTNPPVTPPGSAAPHLSVTPGMVDPSAATTITVTGTGYRGAGAAHGVYVSVGSSSTWRPGQVPSQGGWVTTVWVTPASLSADGTFITTLRIPAGALSSGGSYGVASFAAHELSLTNRSLDAWTALKLGVSGSKSAAAATTTAAAEAPATEGIELETSDPREGGTITATASGFQPNERGILVVIYSDPVVLDNSATADSTGTVRWTGRLPGGLTGSHTLTFQGSTEVGVPIEIAPRTVLECRVDDARLDWGVKESFRSYISGSIANGEWTTAGDAGYETPSFFFTGGTGDRDADSGTAVVQFAGSVRFTGHDGVLDTTIANPRIEVGADSATLILDVTGTTQDGRDVVKVAVPFAELDLSDVQPVAADGVITLSEIPATLTAEGADVFGTYEAGEQLDPITLSLPEGTCGAQPASEVEATGPTETAAAVWPVWVGLIALLLVIAAVAFIVVRRRRTA